METNNTAEQENKTFTQEQVDAIVKERLERERNKYTDYADLKAKAAKFDEAQAANATDLEKLEAANGKIVELEKKVAEFTRANEVREIREAAAKEHGIPAGLFTGEDAETCAAQAAALLDWKKSSEPNYPDVKDAGEVAGRGSAENIFANWFDENIN